MVSFKDQLRVKSFRTAELMGGLGKGIKEFKKATKEEDKEEDKESK